MTIDSSEAAPIACNMGAFNDEERRHYDVLRAKVHAAVEDIRELADGFSIRLSCDPEVLATAGEWIALERRCCPFFDFALSVPRGDGPAELRITGPAPAKEILRDGLYQAPHVSVERLRRAGA
jgi:hypothetical protein